MALLALVAADSALAQAGGTVVTGAQGAPTMTVGNTLQTLTNGMTIPDGAQIVVPQGSAVSLDFGGACSVTVPGGPFTATLANCQSLVAAQAAGTAPTYAGASSAITPLTVAAAVGGVAALSVATKGSNTPISNN
jgi:hypothetical protein